MKTVTVRVPATTANLGPGFDSFGCALSLYTHITVAEIGLGLTITGCDEAFSGPDNLVYKAYCATMETMGQTVKGVQIHIDAKIPICRGLGSSAALLAAGAMAANALHGSPLSKQQLLAITNAIEGHPDNLAPAFYGGLIASMVRETEPVCASFQLHPEWKFLAMVPDFTLSTALARNVLPEGYSRKDAVYNISHAALVLKALETGDTALLAAAMDDRIHQPYRKALIPGYDRLEALVRSTGGAFCLSGAGPTLLCITRQVETVELLSRQLPQGWALYSLQADLCGAQIMALESV